MKNIAMKKTAVNKTGMEKTALFVVLALFLCLLLPAFAFADTAGASGEMLPRLVDDAGLLRGTEANRLLEKLDELSSRQRADVVVVTVNSLEGKSSTAYADDFFDNNGYGVGSNYDGILLLLSMEDRDYAISTCGFGITAFTDAGLRYMTDEFLHYISDGDYYAGFDRFAGLCDEFLEQARNGKPYDVGNMPNQLSFFELFVKRLPVSLIVGIVIAIIATGVMKGKLKSVRMQAAAASYIREGSVNITNSSDNFLYSTVSKTERESSSSSSGGGSSTHSSSSGSSHGGSSGKF